MKQCPNCHKEELPDELHFCPGCGSDLDAAQPPQMQRAEQEQPPAKPKEKKPHDGQKRAGKRKRRALLRLATLCAGAVLAVTVVVLVLVQIAGKPRSAPLLYLRDGMVRTAQQEEELRLCPAALQTPLPDAVFAANRPERFIFVSQSNEDGTLSELRYMDLKSGQQGATQLETEAVKEYGISADGKTVWYLTQADELYLHDLSQKKQIAKGVSQYLFSEDLSRCAYMTQSGELYCAQTDNPSKQVKLTSAAISLDAVCKNWLAYTRKSDNGTELVIYSMKNASETVHKNARVAASLSDQQGFYFIQSNEKGAPWFEDPNAQTDAEWVVQQGEKSEYGYPAGEWYYWYSFYEAQGRQEVSGDLSSMTREAYLQYSARMAVRSKAEELGAGSGTLYFFNGKKAVEVQQDVVELLLPDGEIDAKTPLVCVTLSEQAEAVDLDSFAEKILGSVKAIEYDAAESGRRVELTFMGEGPQAQEQALEKEIRSLMNTQTELALIKKTQVTMTGIGCSELEQDAGSPFLELFACPKGEKIVFLAGNDANTKLYAKQLQPGAAAQQLSENAGEIRTLAWGTLSCVQEDEQTCTLYADAEKVDSGIEKSSIVLSAEQDCIYYLKGFNGLGGDLYRWQNGKSVLLCENVHTFTVQADGEVFALRNYNARTEQGELVSIQGRKEPKNVADGVVQLLSGTDPQRYIQFAD